MAHKRGISQYGGLVVGIMVVLFSASWSACSEEQAGTSMAQHLLSEAGVTRGICSVPRCSDGELALAIAENSDMLVHAMDERPEGVAALQKRADALGLLGRRLYVERGSVSAIPFADNCVDLIVIAGTTDSMLESMPRREILRVLTPCNGRAIVGSGGASVGKLSEAALKKWAGGFRVPDIKVVQDQYGLWAHIRKPPLDGADDWSHPYHGPDNNPQSKDRVVVAPYLTQFLANPRYAPLPQVAVASAGRVFKAFGHVAFKTREEPFLNKLVAFNGYNGTILWQRDLAEGVMVHRNTMIATPTALYVGDDKSCKVIDAVTGELRDEIIPPVEVAGGTWWKWMGMEDGVLYAMIGEEEQRDPTMRWQLDWHGWPWEPISKGFNQPENPWGFGRDVLAIDPKTKKILWSHHEDEPVDARAMCMKNGRIYIFRFGEHLTCLDAKTGSAIWRKTPENAHELFESLGEYLDRQDWRTNWRTTCYLKCTDRALYFAGPQIGRLLVVSTEDASIMWEHAYDNFQLVVRGGQLYGVSGETDERPSVKLASLTGEELALIDMHRRACARPTGSADAIFFRATGGTVRLDSATSRPEWISPMRPNCHDGVTVANGLLYWWPSVCDCQLTLYGVTCLGPAGDFNFAAQATEVERLERASGASMEVAGFTESPNDWPTLRADNVCSAATNARIPERSRLLWSYTPKEPSAVTGFPATPPVAAGGLAFVSGADGSVRALDAATGQVKWTAYTGGAVRIPPTIWKGRAFVGSGDGWVYAFEAATGRLIWRFRAAPASRNIPVYGSLSSTWPVTSGVLVENGTAYFAAGIANYDGTYVYALDAATGRIRWQNNTSGHLDRQARTGVSVQGHMLLHDGKLYLAGGNAVSPAVYDVRDGRCLNDPTPLARCVSESPRGWELSLLGGHVAACGKPFYAHQKHDVYDSTVFDRIFLAPIGEQDVVWISSQHEDTLLCFNRLDRQSLDKGMLELSERRGPDADEAVFHLDWGGLGIEDEPLWHYDCEESRAVAVCANAVVVAEESQVVALSLADGSVLWSQPVPSAPATWGLAVDRDGRVIVTLEDGKVLCFG